jgi:hypothetical protein
VKAYVCVELCHLRSAVLSIVVESLELEHSVHAFRRVYHKGVQHGAVLGVEQRRKGRGGRAEEEGQRRKGRGGGG